MAFSLTLPELGESVTEGTVTRWLKQEGDHIDVDEPLLEISTDKVDTEVPSPVSGTVSQIVATVDTTVEVGAELAVIDDGSGGAAPPAQEQQQAPAAAEQQPQDAQQQPQQAQEQQAQQEQAPEPAAQGSGAQQQAPETSGAATPVTLPELGESVTEGTVTRWLKQEGDHVDVDEPLLEISTDKVDTEVPSPVSGTVVEITAHTDQTVEVGSQLALVGDSSAGGAATPTEQAPQEQTQQQAPQQAQQTQQAQQPAESAPAQPSQEQPAAPAREPEPAASSTASSAASSTQPRHAAQEPSPSGDGGVSTDTDTSAPYVTPLVRKLASENDIDLNSLEGSGVGGRIRKQDVMAAVENKRDQASAQPAPATPSPAQPATSEAPAQAPGAAQTADTSGLRGTTQKANRVRLTIAKRTKESLRDSAQLTQVHEVDVTKVARLREHAKAGFAEREGVKLTFLPFFAKATVEALKQHPNINAYLDEEAQEITYFNAEHLAIAVDTERGLISPVLHNAGDLNLSGLASHIDDLATRTRTNKITPSELSGGTFTVTNLGSNGALFDTPIINQPQSGILGVGAVVKRPMVISDFEGNDTIAIRSMAYLSLTYDHRLIDGADAGRFVTTVKHRLQEGNFETDLGL